VATPSKLIPVVNVLMAQLNLVVAMVGSFVITPRILDALGDSAYGGWLLVTSMVLYIRMLDLGVSTGAMKYGAGAEGRGDESDLTRVFNTTAAVFLTVGAAAVVITLALTVILPRAYPGVLAGQGVTILILGSAVAIDLGFRTYASALRARSLFFVNDLVETITYSIFKLGLVLYFASHGLSYRILALLTLAESVGRNIIVIIAALRASPVTRHLHPFRADRAMLKKIGSMGGAMTILRAADIVRFSIDAAVIGYYMPKQPEAISIFGIGSRLASMAYLVIGVIASVMVPRFSALSESRDEHGVAGLLAKTSLVTSLATSYVLVNLAVFGTGFLDLWLDKPWIDESGAILLILIPGYAIALLSGSAANLLVGRGMLRGQTILTVAEAIANFVLSVILVRPLGVYGVALGTTIPMVIARGIAFPRLIHGVLGIDTWQYVKMNGRGIIVAIVHFAAIFALRYVPITSYGRLVALGLASTAVFVAIALAVVPEARAVAAAVARRAVALARRLAGKRPS
jgi:O-antigen/teichoic acid export membrane protein